MDILIFYYFKFGPSSRKCAFMKIVFCLLQRNHKTQLHLIVLKVPKTEGKKWTSQIQYSEKDTFWSGTEFCICDVYLPDRFVIETFRQLNMN